MLSVFGLFDWLVSRSNGIINYSMFGEPFEMLHRIVNGATASILFRWVLSLDPFQTDYTESYEYLLLLVI